ncbi:MAG: hypothetical protein A2887_05705 [Alphaproteobacteria bacterium RIFCSPLOWO2_01_FULL_40_26]|nr:MAG: hypothetical protein A3D15_01965 [Alphaproteobacteria bacterium RIFCSPHIGHO2_02_FULL_40_34]OFW85614.1 MAG: hypothetical protein A2794_00925 [Alphaproteobacteria bacterium RIFCSPHIGHO2_01_FULL_40_8]OFW94224.1 MAG: hypothetical protein A2887_05705 [Alphaproteobacteria bacterium RIFCSPLOWO2_01_FULL_40_26]OFX09793.1 MAG: hypothetical protein A3H30_00465 [Alphaproteobacteria bacterium RIFCSPLOWO2_02_FULL_40_19]OFX12266.1 MAG: hypothetical protein A3G22_06965 [Alphaproteobacteria bacterium RI
MKRAFSLIELSIVILIIGILIAGVTQSSRLVKQMRLNSARSLTQSSPVNSIKDLILWVEPTLESSFDSDLGNGDAVAKWNDINPQSSYKINLSQDSSGNRPTYLAEGIGGIPSIKFSGSTGTPLYGKDIYFSSPSYTIFMVFKPDTVSESALLGAFYDNDSNWTNESGEHGINLQINSSTPKFRALHRGPTGASGGNSNVSSSDIVAKKDYIFSYVRNYTVGATLWLNNAVEINQASASAGSFDKASLQLVIGTLFDSLTARKFDGQFSELIIFDRALRQSEIDDVEAYLSKKYSVKF